MTPKNRISSDWKAVGTLDALPLLPPEELQLWRVELTGADILFEACMSYLTEEEHARSARRRHAQSRRQFVIGRGCLRLLLGAVLETAPRLVPITAGPHGKPELPSPGSAVSFNVAHSGDTVLIALCRHASVGVDLEQINPSLEFMPVAQASFTRTETMKLAELTDPAQQRMAFYRCWTQKEAVAKADGRGLALPMSSFEVPISPAHSAPVSIKQPSRTGSKVYYVTGLPLGGAEFAGAVALDTGGFSMKLLRFPPLG